MNLIYYTENGAINKKYTFKKHREVILSFLDLFNEYDRITGASVIVIFRYDKDKLIIPFYKISEFIENIETDIRNIIVIDKDYCFNASGYTKIELFVSDAVFAKYKLLKLMEDN